MENCDWSVWGAVLTAIATFGLVVIGFRQTKIQKTQTDIQNKALKISLLEQRLQCLNDINNMRSSFLIPRDIANKIGFYNTGSGSYNLSDITKTMDASLYTFVKAVENSKYLFSCKHYDYLKTTFIDLSTLLMINKEMLFKTNFITNMNASELNQEKQKILHILRQAIDKNEILERETFEVLGMDYNQYMEITNRLTEKFSNEQFFASFDEYLNIGNI